MKRRNDYLTNVGSKVRSIRKLRGLSYVTVAESMDMKPEVLRRIEKGYTSPLLLTLKRIADALGVDIKVFL